MANRLVLVGDGGVGKTALRKRWETGEFEYKYVPTLGVSTCQLSKGGLPGDENENEFPETSVWDTAGTAEYQGLREGYYIGAKAVVLLFDVTRQETFLSVPGWLGLIRSVNPQCPIMLCGTKVDAQHRKVSPGAINKILPSLTRFGVQAYHDISAKSCHNWDRPLRWFASLP
jgi:GTP-binding nuclear protein Ran